MVLEEERRLKKTNEKCRVGNSLFGFSFELLVLFKRANRSFALFALFVKSEKRNEEQVALFFCFINLKPRSVI